MSTDVTAPTVAPKVEVGPTTVAGWGAALVGAIGFILVQFFNVDQDEAVTVATAAFTIVAFGLTQFGRYRQAEKLAEKAPVVAAPVEPTRSLNVAGQGLSLAAGDPDHPLRERELSDEEIRSIVGPEQVDDPDTDPPSTPGAPSQIH